MGFAAEVPSPQVQIAGAVLAAPAELRAGAAVLGFDGQGGRVKLREGTNEMICLAPDPAKTTFESDCYHKDLEPFMARGRELLAQKITGAKRNEIPILARLCALQPDRMHPGVAHQPCPLVIVQPGM